MKKRGRGRPKGSVSKKLHLVGSEPTCAPVIPPRDIQIIRQELQNLLLCIATKHLQIREAKADVEKFNLQSDRLIKELQASEAEEALKRAQEAAEKAKETV